VLRALAASEPTGARTSHKAASDPSIADRTWVLLTEAPEGGWGLKGHANTNPELVAAARAEIAALGTLPADS
jgi:hypothetical protein